MLDRVVAADVKDPRRAVTGPAGVFSFEKDVELGRQRVHDYIDAGRAPSDAR